MKESDKKIKIPMNLTLDNMDKLIQTFSQDELEALVARAQDYLPRRLKELEEEHRRRPPTEESTNVSPPYIVQPQPPIAPLTPMSKAAKTLRKIKESNRGSENPLAQSSLKSETPYPLRRRRTRR